MKAFRYFFPKRPLRERLPLPPRRYSSSQTPYPIPPERLSDCRLLIAAGVARTTSDAYRLIVEYPTMTYRQIIRKTKRKRRPRPRWVTFLIRLKKLLIGMVAIVALLSAPLPTNAQDEPPIGTGRIIAGALNVRALPDPTSARLGVLRRGAVVTVYEVRDGWLRLRCTNQPCWINGSPKYVQFAGEGGVVVNATRSLPDLQLASYVVDPATPAPGQPFRLVLTLKNAGGADANLFSVAAAFSPSNHFAFVTVGGLAAGGQGTVSLDNSAGETVTGRHTIGVALDVEDTVQEGAAGEANNVVMVSYWIDRPYTAQSRLRIEPQTNVDIHGGAPDFAWDGTVLRALSGAALAVLDMPLSEVHHDLLDLKDGQAWDGALQAGMIVGFRTAEGRRGVLRVVSVSPLEIQYAIYANK